MARVPPLLAFVACTLIWGTTWLAIKVSYAGIDAVWAASLRFFVAGLALLLMYAARREAAPIRRVDVAVAVFVGVVLFGADYGLIYWGEQFIPSGLTAILFSTMTLFVGLFSAILMPHERIALRHGGGVLLGILGLVIVFRDSLSFDAGALWPMAAIVLSAACAAISSVVMRRWARGSDAFFINGGAMTVGAVVLLVASLTLGESQTLPVGLIPWAATTYLALVGSVLSFLLYWILLHNWGPNRSSLIILLTPIVAVSSGLTINEWLSPLQILGSAVVLGGVALSLYQPRPARGPAAAPAGGK